MITKVEDFIKNIEKKDRIINYIKNIYKVEIGDDIVIPDKYLEADEDKENQKNTSSENNVFDTFEEKIMSLNLPNPNDKNVKLKLQKLRKLGDTKILIRKLDISYYDSKGMTTLLFKRLVEGLKTLKSVEVLNLRNNNIDDTYTDLLVEVLGLDSTKRVDLRHNNITKNSTKKLVNLIKATVHFEYFDISYNPICTDEYACINLCNSIKAHTNLYHFGISDCSRDSAIRVFAFKKMFRSLNLDDSLYKYRTYEYLFRLLGDRRYYLAVLSLRFTNMDLINIVSLEKSLRANKSLISLNLYASGISDRGGATLVNALQYNYTLSELYLGKNRLGDQFAANFKEIIPQNKIITIIDISRNFQLNTTNFSIIIEGLVNNQSITSLGNLTDLKIGVKLRESAEVILNLNQNFSKENVNLELNKSHKELFFKASIDFENLEKSKREALVDNAKNLNNENTNFDENFEAKFANELAFGKYKKVKNQSEIKELREKEYKEAKAKLLEEETDNENLVRVKYDISFNLNEIDDFQYFNL